MGERLKDKVALVTGAGSSGPGWGNGKATAVLFAREGARVCVIDINRDAVEETAGIIRDEGGECLVDQVDVTDAEQVAAVVAKCVDHWGRVDILHNNVGILDVGGPVDASLESWERVVSVNLTSMFLTCKYVLPVMEAQGGGAIVNIASIAGIRYLGIPYVSYSATKGAVHNLSKNLAREWAPHGVRVNVLVPGFFPAEQNRKVLTPDRVEAIMRHTPMDRFGDKEELVGATLLLASDKAGNFLTGHEMVVDGGYSCMTI